MTDFTHEHLVSNLSAPAARLAGVLSRPRRVGIVCVVALTSLGWLALALMMARFQPLWQVLCGPSPEAGPAELALAIPMWTAMVLAMMLPTAGPMIITYSEIADTATHKGEPVVSPLVLAAGYVVVWLGFALAAALAQWTLARAGLIDDGSVGRLAGGTIFLGAGLYQFSALKRACLSQCQRPFPFFFANWTSEPVGVFRLGLRQGMFCFGCCWAIMLLMFALGAMNVMWMAALGVLMTLEKLASTQRLSDVIGCGLIAVGFGLVAWSVL